MHDRLREAAARLEIRPALLEVTLRCAWPPQGPEGTAHAWLELSRGGVQVALSRLHRGVARLGPVAHTLGPTAGVVLRGDRVELDTRSTGWAVSRWVSAQGAELAALADTDGLAIARIHAAAPVATDWLAGWRVAPWLAARLTALGDRSTGWDDAVRAGLVYRLWQVDPSDRDRYRQALLAGAPTPPQRVAQWTAEVWDRAWDEVTERGVAESDRLDCMLLQSERLGPSPEAARRVTEIATLRDDLESAREALSVSGRAPERWMRRLQQVDVHAGQRAWRLRQLPGGLPSPWRRAAAALDRSAWWPRVGAAA